MHKTIYIDVDEEITSIVDRIKTEELSNIVLVVPKNAMLTQGVINLKMLKKEIEKLGKTVTIATNDKHARAVIERLEIKTQEAKGDLTKNEVKQIDKDIISKKAANESLEILGDSGTADAPFGGDEVGTDSFFSDREGPMGIGEQAEIEEAEEEPKRKEPVSIPPQPMSEIKEVPTEPGKPSIFKPQQLKEALYAKKQAKDADEIQAASVANQPSPAPTAPVGGLASDMKPPALDMSPKGGQKLSVKNENPGTKDLFGNIKEDEKKLEPTKGLEGGGNYAAEKAEKFFSHEEEVEKKQEQLKEQRKENKQRNSKNTKFWFGLVVIMLLIGSAAAIGSWAYANYPKVNVIIYPESKNLSKEIKIISREGISSSDIDTNEIPGKFVEMVISKSMDFDASGETYETDDGKARGKVKIYNKYSTSTQQLVATTRLLSTEGKLFRIVNDIVVPGMEGEEPGVIEVAVIADKPGEDYNIGPSKFTIEGFMGNPKYTAFEVESERTMTDGGAPDETKKMAMVTETDIANARIKTIEAMETTLENEIENKLENDLKIIVDSVEKEIQSTKSSREANEVAASFTYTVEQKVKAIAFFAEDVNFVEMSELEKDVEDNFVMESVSQVTFKKGIADYEKKSLTMYVDASALSWPSLNQAEIIEGIVGKNENEIKSFLSSYKNIEKAEIEIAPSWLTTIPISKDKISIKEEK